ncbi:response regulator transcription factor [Microbacterium sp. No. 7]|uniref:response regulator transcription factor n=1 Tax=Microbacterium sp. No. 7 TaxID=1714373 RepID=UPI0006D0956B|nr:response regulator transcription factor [Microbacterium sp. No. 7]ALJ19206.1 hypothetical protein AOA12_04535 [Microbacterium sp. No. 7]
MTTDRSDDWRRPIRPRALQRAYLRIGVVDPHPALALGVTAILNAQTDMHVVSTAPTVSALAARRERMDVVLVGCTAAEAAVPIPQLSTLSASTQSVLLYVSDDAEGLPAYGVVRKQDEPDELVRRVRQAAHPAYGRGALGREAPAFANVPVVLTERERQVLALYAGGRTAGQVASRLFISRGTVHDHIRRIRAKYEAAGRPAPTKVDLFRRAVEDGIVRPDGA